MKSDDGFMISPGLMITTPTKERADKIIDGKVWEFSSHSEWGHYDAYHPKEELKEYNLSEFKLICTSEREHKRLEERLKDREKVRVRIYRYAVNLEDEVEYDEYWVKKEIVEPRASN